MKTWQKLRKNPELLQKYLVRGKAIDAIRAFFKEEGFTEVQTPILVPTPSAEPNLEVFETQLRTTGGEIRRAFLITSPEYALKKLIAAGIGDVFEITRSFRNEEEISGQHNPEFTILEWYRTGADYKKIMEDFERLVTTIMKCNTSNKPYTTDLSYRGQEYDLTRPWPRISVAEAFEKYAGIETEIMLTESAIKEAAKKKGYVIDGKTSWEQVFYQIFFNEIEPQLKASHRPCFIYDYPLAQGALSRRKTDDPRFCERFEVFLAGIELGNCFSELTDASEQEERFRQDLAGRKKAGKTEYPMDSDLIEALRAGMPQTAGIAVGVDRLVMLLADTETIEETLFFPGGELFDLKGASGVK